VDGPQAFAGFSLQRQLVTLAYGYRVGEVRLKDIKPVKDGTKIDRFVLSDRAMRPVMMFSLGAHLDSACLPHPDISCSHTLLAGVAARFSTRPPRPNPDLMVELREFVAGWLRDNLSPLMPDVDVSFETWVKECNQPEWRKDELRKAYEAWDHPRKKDFEVKMFMKKETYTDWKHGRAINSRSDEFKTMVGPIFHAIESELFKRPEFIKKIPVNERARYVYEKLYRVGGRYYSSDFTSFEALFTREIMEAVEFQLYEYMTSRLPDGHWFMSLIRVALLGVNRIKNKNISLRVEATRMSGEMCTSLGNGFSNLMFNLFVAWKSGAKLDGVVEGDDGLFRYEGVIDDSLFEKLGLIIKLERHIDLATASFCGQIFDPQNFVVITDPMKVLASVGWIDGKYVRARRGKQLGMLRAKAWSFGYQYPQCPIISAMSRALLRLTRSVDHRIALRNETDWWSRNKLQEAFDAGRPELNQPVHDATRDLMYRVFGISQQDQVALERWFDQLWELKPFPNFGVPKAWTQYFEDYCVQVRYLWNEQVPVERWRQLFDVKLPFPFPDLGKVT
jgi:hypothetical protein